MVKRLLRNDTGIRYKSNTLKSILQLKCSVNLIEPFLDMNISICPISNTISTTLKIKEKKLNTFIDEKSNHGFDNYYGIWSSENFRSICLNDNPQDHVIFNNNLLLKARERNWSYFTIRKIKFRCKLRYNLRLNYIKSVLKNIYKKQKQSKYKYSFYLNDKFSILTQEEFLHIENTIIKPNETEIIRIYFKKQSNRFLNLDVEIRELCNQLIQELGLEDVEIILCNTINDKLGPKILY